MENFGTGFFGKFFLIKIKCFLANLRIFYLLKNNVFQKNMLTKEKEDCEHRFFHIMATLNNHARIMIAPVTIFS